MSEGAFRDDLRCCCSAGGDILPGQGRLAPGDDVLGQTSVFGYPDGGENRVSSPIRGLTILERGTIAGR